MMESHLNIGLDSSINYLETAFSDSTHKLIRRNNVEWQRVIKCRNDLTAKKDELREAKENRIRFIEIKTQNENYLKSSEKRLEDLKRSNAEFKSKMIKLGKEKEKVVKDCNEQEEYLRQKVAFYEEKWRERYETRYSKNPKMVEKVKGITEVYELKEKLQISTEEEKKYEKALVGAKSKRSVFTEGRQLYPFQNFVLNIAKIYLETKKIYGECEKISKEIEDAENRIKSKRQILSHDKLSRSKHPIDVVQNFEQNAAMEKNNLENSSEYSNVEMIENDTEPELSKDMNFGSNMNVKAGSSMKCVKSFPNDLIDLSGDANQNSFSTTGDKSNTSLVKEGDYTTKSAKVLPDVSKTRKWMERLKIFVPKFRTIPEENYKHVIKDDENLTKPVGTVNTKIGGKVNLNDENLNDVQCNANTKNTEKLEKTTVPLKILSAKTSAQHITAKNVKFADVNLGASENLTLPTESLRNTSKYFEKINEEVEPMEWDKEFIHEKQDVVIEDHMKSNESEGKRNTEGKIIEIKRNLNHETLTFSEQMDTDEQPNEREFESSIEKMKGLETDEVTAENVVINTLFMQTNRAEETKQSEVPNEASIFSSDWKEKGTIDKYQNRNVSSDEIQREVLDQHQNANTKRFHAIHAEPIPDDVETGASKQHQLHHLLDASIPKAPITPKSDPERKTEIVALKESNINEENIQHIQANAFQTDLNISNKPPQAIQPNRILHSPGSSPKKSEPGFKIPTDSNPKTPSLVDSNSKTPLTRQSQNSGESLADVNGSKFAPFNADSASPGFAFTTRLMYPVDVTSNKNNSPEIISKDPQNSMFAQMTFFNNSPRNIVYNQDRSPPEDKSQFLAVDYEDYLADSPPMIKGTEKSMFAFTEDSPDNENKNDFFPLFASDNGESTKGTGNCGTAFTFNFGSSSQAQSPDQGDNQGFKFLF